ncbi:MAG: hybrid sensor histidine kinase/response regulator [Asticcacaulis sp.]
MPGNAYNLPGCYAFVVTIFVMVLLRMFMVGDFGHIVLGLASALFALIMVLFARVQNRTFRDGFDIRFENIELLEETRLAQLRAEAANLAKSQFLAAASHDLRQPLYALSLFSGSLKSFALDDDGHDLVRKIQDNIAAMETLFNGLLDLSRLEAGAVKTDIHAFAVQPLFDRLEHYFAPQARAQALGLTFRPTALWVEGDEVLAEQILMNLIANALRYTASGRILIAARKDGGHVSLQVFDTGKGIDAADQARISRSSSRSAMPSATAARAWAWGLAIASRTAQLLGGAIGLRSQPGKGSRFAFSLPRAEARAAVVRSAPAAVADLTASTRVLIVDDDQAVREALDRLLGGWGLDFAIASGLDEARVALKGAPFQVVLCDYRLREGHVGLDFLSEIKRDGGPGLCLITGDVDSALMKRAADAGIFLIHKPVDPARLRALLNHLASRATA